MPRGTKRAAVDAGPVEGSWELPKGWRWERLGALVEKSSAKHLPDVASDLRFVGLEHIPPHQMTLVGDGAFREMRSAGSAFEEGDVLYGRLRPYLNKVWKTTFAGACSGELLVLRPHEGLEASYLAYLLHGPDFVAFASQSVTGDRPRMDFAVMAGFAVPVPPPDVQDTIVARIDELFAEVDDAERALSAVRVGADEFRQSLLKAAFSGDLTGDLRGKSSYTCSNELGDPVCQALPPDGWSTPLPVGWVWRTLGSLFSIAVGATPSRSRPELWTGPVPWVSSGEVAFGRISSTRETISTSAVSRDRIHPPGTVMLGMIGEGKTRGQAAILDIAAAHNQNCASIRVSDTLIPPEFVYHWLEYRYESTRANGSGGNQPALNKGRVSATAMPLPPLKEIEQIVHRIATAQQVADEAIEASRAAASQVGALRRSILAAAFRGDLAA